MLFLHEETFCRGLHGSKGRPQTDGNTESGEKMPLLFQNWSFG